MASMTFRNYGGLYQLEVRDERDLSAIDALDPARWAATSAPAVDLRCDAAFLAFLDPDGKGRIRVSHVVAARDWLFKHLSGRSRLADKVAVVRLDDIDPSHEAGARIRRAAEHVLAEQSAAERTKIDLEQVRAFRTSYLKTLANGDGVICPEVVPDGPTAALVRDIMAVAGSVPEASGRPGVGADEIDRFLVKARAYLIWRAAPTGDGGPAIRPLGEGTAAAAALVTGLDSKLDQYFKQCDLVRLEPRAEGRMKLDDERLKAIEVADSAALEQTLATAPLAPPRASGALPLAAGDLNPLFEDRVAALTAEVVRPLLGAETTEIAREDWARVKTALAPYQTWLQARPAEPFEKLGDARLLAILDGPEIARLRALVAQDLAAAAEVKELANLEKLLLYHRFLVELVNNFVNFSALYDPRLRSLLEVGTLVVDGRRLELSVRVENRDAHKKVAAESLMFLVYAKVTDAKEGKTFEIATPVTAGERGRIRVGKRGIFLALDGRELDAEIVDIVESSISLWEAMKAPFVRTWAFVSKKFEDLAASRLAAEETVMKDRTGAKVTTAVPTAAGGAPPATAPAPAPAPAPGAPGAAPAPGAPAAAPGGGMMNVAVMGGVLIAALGSALAFIVSTLSKINPLDAISAVAAVAGVIAVASGFLGWLKLRRRDLGLLLEANGWALNGEMRLTGRLGRLFTRTPALPKGSRKVRADIVAAYADTSVERRQRLKAVGAAILIVTLLALYAAYRLGWLARGLAWLRASAGG